MSDDTVLVTITGSRQVRYAATKRIPKTEWERWQRRRGIISDYGCEMEFGDLLTSSDIVDQDNVEDFDIAIKT